jgi:hypothetical protein
MSHANYETRIQINDVNNENLFSYTDPNNLTEIREKSDGATIIIVMLFIMIFYINNLIENAFIS